ncbi:hypothetical protein EPUS_03257 [Endocarpon pusillum Z07020]|uniref:Uncharacterized protein n=1 Tax=Endocarpon pusillum (strain Z07020 / HMAS-L-300199) TaxID=1263415 RepID=U1GR80_ENDPU|nr:uncharacterized protein EPUS_03257 [Endocarpon pusillum Z07020]ERF74873.1 hypothetical protein EPUS_03257 [Endocarpon pusillum Z07020]
MELRMAQILPPGYLYGSGFVFSGSFSQLYTAFGRGAPIPFSYTGCGDSCTTTLQGFGFSVNCSTVPVSNDDARAGFRSENVTTIGSAVPVFNVSSSLYGEIECDLGDSCFAKNKAAAELGRIEIANLFKAAPDCESDVSVTSCSLQQAIVEYDVVLQDGIVSLQHAHWQNDTVLYNTPPWDEPESLNYYGITPWWSSSMNWVNFFMLQFNEELDRYGDGELGPASMNPIFRLAQQFINDDAVNSLNSINCNTTFDDPSQYVVDRIREIAFRTSVAAATVTNNTILFGNDSLITSGLPLIRNWTQTVSYTGRSTQTVYSVSTAYLISAVVVSLLGVVAIAPLYWGWWELGRDVSFNPLEVAKAFHAEILIDADWNMSKEGLVKMVGEREVSYRVVDEGVKEEFKDVARKGGEET